MIDHISCIIVVGCLWTRLKRDKIIPKIYVTYNLLDLERKTTGVAASGWEWIIKPHSETYPQGPGIISTHTDVPKRCATTWFVFPNLGNPD